MGTLSEDDLKKVIARRDRRFDGQFYFGVSTTKIYCRPVCPAQPKPEHIKIFKSSTEAERHGYRPCKRCRPDLAPGCKFLDGTANSVLRALRILDASLGEHLSVDDLANTLGISDRHLRRLFDEHLGASPLEVIATQRLHFCKQLVEASTIPFNEIAFLSGFQSVRRFNEVFKSRFYTSPSILRKEQKCGTSMSVITESELVIKIPVRLPYDWKTVLSYLRGHECYGVESISDGQYQRFFVGNKFSANELSDGQISDDQKVGRIRVSDETEHGFLSITLLHIPLTHIRFVLTRCKQLFDTEHNPAHLPSSETLDPKGIRVPGSFDPFETAVSIILGQLVSIAHARTNLKTLVKKFGNYLTTIDAKDVYQFPSAAVLAEAPVETIGITKIKAHAISALATAVMRGEIDFTAFADFSEMHVKILSIKGIGPWTAAMISMRCLGDPDAFPHADLIIKRALDQQLADHSEWSSSRAYLTHCLWRDYAHLLSKVPKRNAK